MNPFPYAHRYRRLSFQQETMPAPKKPVTSPLDATVARLLVRVEDRILAEGDAGGKLDGLPERERVKLRAILSVLLEELGGYETAAEEPAAPRAPRKPPTARKPRSRKLP